MIYIQNQQSSSYCSPFYGDRFDTCDYRSSVISEAQQKSYWTEFGLLPIIRTMEETMVTGIAGEINVIGMVKLEIPLKDFRLIIEVDLLVLKEPIPTLL